MRYNKKIVEAYFVSCGLPKPEFEYQFHKERKWRFDLAWPEHKVALEVQGGIWGNGEKRGRHTRGAALLKEWEKLNTAAGMGWRILYCQPCDVCMCETAEMIKTAIEYKETI